MTRQVFEPFGNQAAGILGDAADAVAERDLPSSAREHHRPGTADQPGSNHSQLRHGRVLCSSAGTSGRVLKPDTHSG
jgi:hypothetical protein